MKTKLTLTVRKNVIDKAKRYSKKTGKSISQIFEEFFESAEPGKSETQLAAERLLRILQEAETIPAQQLSDKELLKEHARRKYA